jgi:hypothetical protein
LQQGVLQDILPDTRVGDLTERVLEENMGDDATEPAVVAEGDEQPAEAPGALKAREFSLDVPCAAPEALPA